MRPLRDFERPLVAYLCELAKVPVDLDALQVEGMDDGGMGSLSIGLKGDRKYGEAASKCHFFDSDNVLVLAELTLDDLASPIEIDVWKVDFSETKTWPERDRLLPGDP